jgi:hypothetical protein
LADESKLNGQLNRFHKMPHFWGAIGGDNFLQIDTLMIHILIMLQKYHKSYETPSKNRQKKR